MKKLILSSLFAAGTTIISAQAPFVFPTLSTPSANDKSIELARLHISVFVVENIATTTLEMEFFNPNNRIMEGELNFPLGDGVTVSRFALDVNGEMREGVVVEKEKATQAFEAVTRQNIDPGLVEVTRGNNFKARIFPIPANGYKKAVIAFEQTLSGDVQNFIYQLPLNLKHKLKDFSVTAEVVMNKPSVPKSEHPNINLTFKEERNSYIANYEEKDIQLDTHLAFSIPKPVKLNKVVSYKGDITSDNYFYINLSLQEETRAKPKPASLTVLWDESTSGKDRQIEKELSILEAYLEWMQTGTIELKTFSNTFHTQKSYSLKDGKCPELTEFLRSTSFDGGTNLNILDFGTFKTDEILLFTDGISNFGTRKESYAFKSPIISVNSSNIADHNLLNYFASASNGLYANAFSLTQEEVMKLLTHEQKRFIKAEYNPENVSEFYPSTAQTVTNQFSCAGITEGSKNEVTLHFGFGNSITESYTIVVDNTIRIDKAVGERIWAQKKLKELLVHGTDAEIKAHGKKFKLVTPGTSLIVLDAVADYVRYEISPPASLQDQYNQLMAEQRKARELTRKERMTRICSEFEADYQWWNTVVDYRKMPVQKDENKKEKLGAGDTEEMLFMEIAADEEAVADMAFFSAESAPSFSTNAAAAPREEAAPERFSTAKVSIQQWDSDAPYMNDLKATDAKELYKTYLKIKPENADNPSFYFDVATYMFQKGEREAGLRVISNLAELELENAEIMRTMGRKLAEYGFYDDAIAAFEEVLKNRSFEPHSYIDLGLVYANKGAYQKSIEQLYTVIEKEWDADIISRFPGIELIVLHEINSIIDQHKDKLDISFVESCLLNNMPVDVRIVIDWDANDTDIDLWVTDPRGEKCSYQNKDTRIGARLSNDITRGYGPEEFRLKYAIDGDYTIEAKFYGSSKQTGLKNVTVRAMVYTRFGSESEHKEILTLQLEPEHDGTYTIGKINFE